MHQAPPEHDKPRPLSQHDPPPDPATRNRAPLLVIVIVLVVVTGLVVLHLTGVVGAGSH